MKMISGVTYIGKRLNNEERKEVSLILDRAYQCPIRGTPPQMDMISKLFVLPNAGGIRFQSPSIVDGKRQYKYCALRSTGDAMYWKDESDEHFCAYVYFGDQNKPGEDILSTPRGGNKFLADVFSFAVSNDPKDRKFIPPIFAFEKRGIGCDIFKGLLVPGIDTMPSEDWLVAFYTKIHRSSTSFLNFKALFTILDTSDGCDAYPNSSGISLEWLNDIEQGKALDSPYCPKAWRDYILKGKRKAIRPFVHSEPYPEKAIQLPKDPEGIKMLNLIHDYFIDIDGGYAFEHFATKLVRLMYPSIVELETTRKYDDGGIDAVGKYQVFKSTENSINLDFYVQAKCYATTNSVDTKDTARLIARIKGKDFGILFTTSYIARQAYNEVIEDKHPVGFVTGSDLINYLRKRLQIRDSVELNDWLKEEFPAEAL